MNKFASSDNIEKVFELISGGTVHKKTPIVFIDNEQINLEGLLKKIISDLNIDIADYTVHNTRYTISVDVDKKTYYLYPIYDCDNNVNNENNYCIYALSSSVLSKGKIYKDIKQEPVTFVRKNGDVSQSYVYFATDSVNNAFASYAGKTLSNNFIPNNFTYLISGNILTSAEINTKYQEDISNKDNNNTLKNFQNAEFNKTFENFDFNNNVVSYINLIK